MRWHSIRLFSALLALAWLAAAPAAAQEYVLGPEDVIMITVWGHGDLTRTVAIRADGNISVPPIGDVAAAGKTTAGLARDLERGFNNTLRINAQVTVAVTEFNSQRVFLAGQVNQPGRHSFERLPNLVDLLSMAGGLNGTADLSQVRILRRGEGGTETITVDVSRAVMSGDLTGVPELRPGDVVFVPQAASAVAAPGVAGGSALTGEVVYILGEVARPGVYNAAGMDVLQLLSLAGGFTPRSSLRSVEIVAADAGNGGYRMRIDLRREMNMGRSGPRLRAGDTVVIPSVGSSVAAQIWGGVRSVLGVSRDIVNILVIRDVLD